MKSEVARQLADYLRNELDVEQVIDLFLYCVDADLAEKVNKLASSGYEHQEILDILTEMLKNDRYRDSKYSRRYRWMAKYPYVESFMCNYD